MLNTPALSRSVGTAPVHGRPARPRATGGTSRRSIFVLRCAPANASGNAGAGGRGRPGGSAPHCPARPRPGSADGGQGAERPAEKEGRPHRHPTPSPPLLHFPTASQALRKRTQGCPGSHTPGRDKPPLPGARGLPSPTASVRERAGPAGLGQGAAAATLRGAAAARRARPLPMRMRICFLPKRREKSEEMVRPMAAPAGAGRRRRQREKCGERRAARRIPPRARRRPSCGVRPAAPNYKARAAARTAELLLRDRETSLARSLPRHARPGRPAPTRTKSRHARHIPRRRHRPPPHGPSAQRRQGLQLPAGTAPASRPARPGGCRWCMMGGVVAGGHPASPWLPAAPGEAERGMPGSVVRRAEPPLRPGPSAGPRTPRPTAGPRTAGPGCSPHWPLCSG